MTTAVLNDLILAGIDRAALLGIEAIALATVLALPLLLIAYYPRWRRQQPQPQPIAAPTPDPQPLTPVEMMQPASPRRQRHQQLIQQAKELHQRAIASDAALLAVGAIAVELVEPRRRRKRHT